MRIDIKKIVSVIPAVTLALSLAAPVHAVSKPELEAAANRSAAYILNTVKNPQVDSVGGEWAVIGLARSGYAVDDSYYENYYRTVEKYVKDRNGILHDKKYTEYSRVILSLTAAGYDPRNVAGYDLTLPLGDFEKTIRQGISGPIFALIALDSLDYPMPVNKDAQTQATRDMYVSEILRRQTPDGGWNLTAVSAGANVTGDSDITGMALQALAKYRDEPEVKAAADNALSFLSRIQDSRGGFASSFSGGASAAESVVQVILALCELGIPLDDDRFIKNGYTLTDNILSFVNADGGSGSRMSAEQALCGLVAALRAAEGKNPLYVMSDAVRRGEFKPGDASGLPGKHADVTAVPITIPGKTFSDIRDHANQAAIEALASRSVINGKSETSFDPDATMTRAEFAAIITRGLGIAGNNQPPAAGRFEDVKRGDWFFEAAETAYHYEIVAGTSATAFSPGGTVTRQEAAVMTARAATLCGLDTARTEIDIRNTLARFGDYRAVAGWAQEATAFCFSEGIWDESMFGFDIEPLKPILRCEVAQMLYGMLDAAELL